MLDKYVDAIEASLDRIIEDEKARTLHQALIEHIRELLEENRKLRSNKLLNPMQVEQLMTKVIHEVPNNKIRAIKEIRSATGLGLRESKDMVDTIVDSMKGYIDVYDLKKMIETVQEEDFAAAERAVRTYAQTDVTDAQMIVRLIKNGPPKPIYGEEQAKQ